MSPNAVINYHCYPVTGIHAGDLCNCMAFHHGSHFPLSLFLFPLFLGTTGTIKKSTLVCLMSVYPMYTETIAHK